MTPAERALLLGVAQHQMVEGAGVVQSRSALWALLWAALQEGDTAPEASAATTAPPAPSAEKTG